MRLRRTIRLDLAPAAWAGDRTGNGARLDAAPRARIDESTGYLHATAAVARSGVQTYSDGDREWGEYRPPSEVFDGEAMASFALVPVTWDHPAAFVGVETQDSARVVGTLGSLVEREDDLLTADLVIRDPDAIAAILAGERTELSAGYDADVEPVEGIAPSGEAYSYIQRRIRANHVAVVEQGRAGPRVALPAVRGADAEPPTDRNDRMHRKTNAQKARAAVRDTAAAVGRAAATRRVDEDIIIEGGTYTVPPEVAAYIARLEAVETAPSVDGEDEPVADAEPAEATTEALEQAAEAVLAAAAAIEAEAPMSEAEPAELAVLDADGDEAVEAMGTGPRDPEPGMAELEDEDEATTAAKTDAAQPSRDAVLARAIRARLDQRSELVAIAARIIPRLDHRASDDALMREVVRRVAPAVAKRADSSSGDYLRAMFDLAVAQHNEAAEQATRNDAASLTATATTRTPADELDAALAGYGSRFSR